MCCTGEQDDSSLMARLIVDTADLDKRNKWTTHRRLQQVLRKPLQHLESSSSASNLLSTCMEDFMTVFVDYDIDSVIVVALFRNAAEANVNCPSVLESLTNTLSRNHPDATLTFCAALLEGECSEVTNATRSRRATCRFVELEGITLLLQSCIANLLRRSARILLEYGDESRTRLSKKARRTIENSILIQCSIQPAGICPSTNDSELPEKACFNFKQSTSVKEISEHHLYGIPFFIVAGKKKNGMPYK